VEARIEGVFVRLLGEGRGVVGCGVVEGVVLGSLKEEEEVQGTGSSSREVEDAGGMDEKVSDDHDGGVTLPRSPRNEHRAKETTPQTAGLQRAHRREKIRQAARRGCAFGFLVDGDAGTGGDEGGETEEGGEGGKEKGRGSGDWKGGGGGERSKQYRTAGWSRRVLPRGSLGSDGWIDGETHWLARVHLFETFVDEYCRWVCATFWLV